MSKSIYTAPKGSATLRPSIWTSSRGGHQPEAVSACIMQFLQKAPLVYPAREVLSAGR